MFLRQNTCSCSLTPGHGDSQENEWLTDVQDNSKNQIQHSCTNTIKCNNPMSLIKYNHFIPSLASSQVSLFNSLLVKPCKDNLSPVSHIPLYQFPSTGLFDHIRCHHPVPHLTIRGPFPSDANPIQLNVVQYSSPLHQGLFPIRCYPSSIFALQDSSPLC